MGGPSVVNGCVATPFCRLGAARHFPHRHHIGRVRFFSFGCLHTLAREGAGAWARLGGGVSFLHVATVLFFGFSIHTTALNNVERFEAP